MVITHPIGRIPTPFSRASFTSSPLVPSRASSSRRASHSTSRAGSPSQGCKNATAPRHAFDPSPSTRVHVPNASPSVDVGTAYGARDLAASVAATANAVRAPRRETDRVHRRRRFRFQSRRLASARLNLLSLSPGAERRRDGGDVREVRRLREQRRPRIGTASVRRFGVFSLVRRVVADVRRSAGGSPRWTTRTSPREARRRPSRAPSPTQRRLAPPPPTPPPPPPRAQPLSRATTTTLVFSTRRPSKRARIATRRRETNRRPRRNPAGPRRTRRSTRGVPPRRIEAVAEEEEKEVKGTVGVRVRRRATRVRRRVWRVTPTRLLSSRRGLLGRRRGGRRGRWPRRRRCRGARGRRGAGWVRRRQPPREAGPRCTCARGGTGGWWGSGTSRGRGPPTPGRGRCPRDGPVRRAVVVRPARVARREEGKRGVRVQRGRGRVGRASPPTDVFACVGSGLPIPTETRRRRRVDPLAAALAKAPSLP